MTIITSSSQQTQNLAKNLLNNLKHKNILCFQGELGSGKTTFIQGLAKELKIKDNIISPTFVIFKKYKTNNDKIKTLYHFDLYRIQDPQEIIDLGFEEIFTCQNCLIAIEWPEKIKNLLPQNKIININLEYLDKNKRKITIQ